MEQKIKTANIIVVEDYAQFEKIESNTLVITATQNLKKNNLFNTAKTIISFADLLSLSNKQIDSKACISRTELRYLIHKSIEVSFEQETALAYQNCVYQLEELYSKLIMLEITENELYCINQNDYSQTEIDIVKIYKKLLTEVKTTQQEIYNVALIKKVIEFVNQYDTVVFVGFVFFNNIQEALVRKINHRNLVFVNKKGDFIQEDLLCPLLTKLGYEITITDLGKTYSNVFSQIGLRLFTNHGLDISNKLIEFHEPFSNREDEFLFIAKEISNNIRCRNLTTEEVEEALQDFAIVLTKNKNELSKILNDAFGQFGVFIPNDNKCINLQSIYYSKEDFLNDDICCGDKPLNYVEKLELFNKCKRIRVSGVSKQAIDFPIGQFIIEIYKVVANGLTIDSFKTLINTQWYINKVADNEAIEDFYKIQVFFEKLTSLEQWKSQVDELVELKKTINNDTYFEMHPLYVVKEKSLKYIQTYLYFLESLTNSLKVNANIQKQIEILIKNFGLQSPQYSTDEEKEMLEMFVSSLQNIETNGIIEVDYKYFAEHITELLKEYSSIQEKENEDMKISVVNMENYTKYEYVYFPMFEENKYPRVLKREFPFTKNIVKMLEDLGIGIQKNLDMDYHLKMSRHIFKNVFSFVNKKIIFTYTNRENTNDLSISVYAKDIVKATNNNVQFITRENEKNKRSIETRELIFKNQKILNVNLNELILRYVCPKQFYYMVALRNKICYIDAFLLNFYAKALIVNKFFTNLAKTNKEFILSSEEFEKEIDSIFEQSYNQILKYFQLFSNSEKKDIRITSKKVIIDFIETHFKAGKFATKKAKFILGQPKTIKGDFVVNTRPTIIMKNIARGTETEFDISRSLDFLISSSGGKKYKFEHFDDIINQLERGNKIDDKLDLVNYASFKVNTQLNNKRFLEDGIKRTMTLINDTPLEFSNMGEHPSSYCRFCKMKNICKGVLIND